MDKLIKIGVEARRHDTKIQEIETKRYNLDISEDEAFDLLEKELVRYNVAWGKIMKEVSEEQFMLEQTMHGTSIN